MRVDHVLDVLCRKVGEVLPLKALEKLAASPLQCTQFGAGDGLDMMRESRCALDAFGRMDNQPVRLHALVVFIEPSGRPVHLLRFAAVNLGAGDVDLALESISVPARARARAADRLHPAMLDRKWQPGQSANPTGRGGLYLECRRLAAEASPNAMRRLIELMNAEDERVSYMATVAVLDRSGVKPIDYDPAQDQPTPSWDPGKLTAEERE